MSTAAFQATFSDFRTVKGRKCCQIILEVPIEQANEALRVLGGVPDPSSAPWVAVARLNPEKVEKEPSPEPEKQKRSWDDLLPSEQAGILCNDRSFWRFMHEHLGRGPVANPEQCAQAIRHYFGIDSRRALNTGDLPDDWRFFVHDFRQWSGRDPQER